MLYSSQRRFQVSRWGVGHAGLLLRSNCNANDTRRIQLLFKPGYAACLPAWLDGVTILHADDAATAAWSAEGHGLALGTDQKLFLVTSGSVHGWVVGGSVSGREDDGDDHTPSSFDGRLPGPEVNELFSTYRR